MIEIIHRYTNAVLYRAESATTLREAVEAGVAAGADLRGAYLRGADLTDAYLRGADLTDADLRGAYLRGADLADADLRGAYLTDADLADADLRGADLTDADLRGAYLRGADLADADLRGADLRGADLRGADLRGADLGGADLRGACGVNKYRTSPLYLLYDQPGPIRLYKLVTAAGRGPFNGCWITYAVGEEYAVADADTNESVGCGAGINLATLDWCLKEWCEGWRILVAEFTAADIAAIPIGTDGKLRVRRCVIVAEKSLDEVGITAERAARAGVAP